MNDVSIVEIQDVDGINKLLKEFYFDMRTDQTEGTVLQIAKCDGIHLLEASGSEGQHGYFYTLECGDGEMECHALIERGSRGKWGVKAALTALGYLAKNYGIRKFHSTRFSHNAYAGVFLNKLGFVRQKTFDCGHTKDHEPVTFSTYTLEV